MQSLSRTGRKAHVQTDTQIVFVPVRGKGGDGEGFCVGREGRRKGKGKAGGEKGGGEGGESKERKR
jgi:hypothetical protein